MTGNRHLIHFLLAICIGLLPVLGASAASLEHSDSAPMSCVDCDPVEAGFNGSCKHLECNSIMQSCGSQTGSSYLPVSISVETRPLAQVRMPGHADSDYRQNVTEPIYRPPIA